jgi:hypothetical protein
LRYNLIHLLVPFLGKAGTLGRERKHLGGLHDVRQKVVCVVEGLVVFKFRGVKTINMCLLSKKKKREWGDDDLGSQ